MNFFCKKIILVSNGGFFYWRSHDLYLNQSCESSQLLLTQVISSISNQCIRRWCAPVPNRPYLIMISRPWPADLPPHLFITTTQNGWSTSNVVHIDASFDVFQMLSVFFAVVPLDSSFVSGFYFQPGCVVTRWTNAQKFDEEISWRSCDLSSAYGGWSE